tara:strand:- start:5516 stop:6361 length:846 start_codon:yes stop_codon:yes gene_type:complete
MKTISVVTTFHPEGMEKYGQRFLNSFANMVDKNISIVVYAENCMPHTNDPNQIKIINAKEVTKLNTFKERWGKVPKANGIPPDDIKARRPRDWHKAFKWDAVRFANKVYAVFHAAETCGTDWLVWMDADTFVHSNWTYKQFAKLLPDDKWLTYVGRGKGSQTWPECGFYGMNLKHPMCIQFLKEFERFYEDPNNGIFELEEWHDSFVFGHILNQMTLIDNNVLDYSADMYIKSAKTGGGGHPLINTELGTWIDHMKGARKDKGKSLSKDIIVSRKEAYWNG